MGGGYAKSRDNCITIFRGISGITDSCAKVHKPLKHAVKR